MHDPFDLQRFVEAQCPVIHQVLDELRKGRKESHWMWFVFPQIKGLGHSWMATRYAVGSREEAEAYALHSILGPRLTECTRLVINVEGRGIEDIFGFPDHLKFRSSMTLFAHCARDNAVFVEALNKYCQGKPDPSTLARLQA